MVPQDYKNRTSSNKWPIFYLKSRLFDSLEFSLAIVPFLGQGEGIGLNPQNITDAYRLKFIATYFQKQNKNILYLIQVADS